MVFLGTMNDDFRFQRWCLMLFLLTCAVFLLLIAMLAHRYHVIPLFVSSLAGCCGLVISMALALLASNILESTEWISIPFDWLTTNKVHAFFGNILFWMTASAVIITILQRRCRLGYAAASVERADTGKEQHP